MPHWRDLSGAACGRDEWLRGELLRDSSQLVRSHAILKRAALPSAGITIPLLSMLDADAAQEAMLVGQRPIA